MRSLWRSLCSVFLAFCIVFSNSLCALANTTTEQIYSVMPLSYPSTFNINVQTGLYDSVSESALLSSGTNFSNLSNGSPISTTDYANNGYTLNYDSISKKFMMAFSSGSQSSSSNLSIPDGSTLRLTINNLYCGLRDVPSNVQYYLNPNNFAPYKVYADLYFTAMKVVGNTHSGTYHNQTVDITNFLRPAAYPVTASNFFDLDLTLPVIADTSTLDESIDRLYNIYLRYFKIYIVFDNSQLYNPFSGDALFLKNVPVGNSVRSFCTFRYYGDDSPYTSFVNLTYDAGSSSDSTVVGNILQSSISSMGSNISNQISQVKTSISQSTNTITTKIDTMANDVKTGLQNVVTSAQQNTQNIINTVTQKVDQVKTGITEVKDSIIDLPNKLQEMLTGFFVPDEETINSKFAEFETLLSDRFGLIYQSADIIHDFADSLQTQAVMVADTGGVITLPSVTVNLAGVDYTFGGFDVDVIPNGFEALQTAVRLATSMVCTVVFVNMLKNKLEAILK